MATKKSTEAKTPKMQKIEILETYIDRELKAEIRKGAIREVTVARAKELIDKNLAKKI